MSSASPPHEPQPIELRQFLSDLAREPLRAFGEFGDLALHRLLERWWVIGTIVIIFLVARNALAHARVQAIEAKRRNLRRDSPRRIYAQRTMLISLGSLLSWVTFIILLLGQLGLSMNPQTFSLIIGSLSLTGVFVMRPYLADALEGWIAASTGRFRQGDYVDVGLGIAGSVIDVDLRSTRLRGSDGTVYHVRNSELTKFGNRTQSVGKLLVDIELMPADESFVTTDQLRRYEDIATQSLIDLRKVLRGVDAVVRNIVKDPHQELDLPAVAAVAANLSPALDSSTLSDLRSVSDDDTGVLPLVTEAMAQAPVPTTPLFRDIEILGLVTSSVRSVTIRVRVELVDPRSRSHALGLLRRHVFEAFNDERVATAFLPVPEGEWIN